MADNDGDLLDLRVKDLLQIGDWAWSVGCWECLHEEFGEHSHQYPRASYTYQ